MAQDAPVYRAPDPEIDDRIEVRTGPLPEDGVGIPSPYGAWHLWGWFPDVSAEGPWSTRFAVVSASGGEDALHLTIERHANLLPLASWINDELLHVRVWWGRFAGSDLILDVPRRELLYERMFFFPADLPGGDAPPAGD